MCVRIVEDDAFEPANLFRLQGPRDYIEGVGEETRVEGMHRLAHIIRLVAKKIPDLDLDLLEYFHRQRVRCTRRGEEGLDEAREDAHV